jgi:protein involved in polysaccharide export with SLBB domain
MLHSCKKIAFGLIALVMATFVSGCASEVAPHTAQALPPGAAAAQDATVDFQLASDDKIHVTVFGADQISGDYTVDPSGNVNIPLAGTISAAGATLDQLTDRIAGRLRDEHMVTNPQISISVISTRPFYILGEVDKPGAYPFHQGLNIVSAVATAGGFKYRADQDHVFIRRGGKGDEVQVPFASAAPIYPGDIIRIPDRNFF